MLDIPERTKKILKFKNRKKYKKIEEKLIKTGRQLANTEQT
jgi:hypothetical protein